MAFVRVASATEIPAGAVIEVLVDGMPYAVCNVEGNLHALRGICPHHGGPLGQGALEGTVVTCPWHAWSFDCRTGEHELDPSRKVPVYAVKVESDDVFIDLP